MLTKRHIPENKDPSPKPVLRPATVPGVRPGLFRERNKVRHISARVFRASAVTPSRPLRRARHNREPDAFRRAHGQMRHRHGHASRHRLKPEVTGQ